MSIEKLRKKREKRRISCGGAENAEAQNGMNIKHEP